MRIMIDVPHNAGEEYRAFIVELGVYDSMMQRRAFEESQLDQLNELERKFEIYNQHVRGIYNGYKGTG